MNGRKIAAIITDILGDQVIVGEEELMVHLNRHFPGVPRTMLLELVALVLKDPTEIYEERKVHQYHLFYRLDTGRYLTVVLKYHEDSVYFTAIYPTGNKIRNKHKNLKKVKR